MVKVAQLVEHRVVVPRVMGSIPIFHPSLRPKGLRLAAPLSKVAQKSLSARCVDCPPKLQSQRNLKLAKKSEGWTNAGTKTHFSLNFLRFLYEI